MINIWGQVNKFLEKHSKTHFFWSIHFYFIVFFRYTWSNGSPTFSSRPNNMICPTLQNKLLFRRWAALWWWIFFLWIISSGLETGNSRGLNLGNMLDGEFIAEFVWPSLPGMCKLVHCLDGRALSSSPNGNVFSLKCCWNSSIRLRNNRHWSFVSTEGNRYEL